MTIADAEKITEQGGLIYKTFYAKEPGSSGQQNKINFNIDLPDTMSEDEKLEMSFALLKAKGGLKRQNMTLWEVNPTLFRGYKYVFTIDSDVLNPRSADLIRAYDLETYDRAIANPVADQEKVFVDLLMGTNPKTAREPRAYVKKAEPVPAGAEPVNSSNPEKGQASMPKPATGTKGLPQSI